MTVNQLLEFCRTRGIIGSSKLRRKKDIINHMKDELFNRYFESDSDMFSVPREIRVYTPLKTEEAYKSRFATYTIQNEYNLVLSEDFLIDISALVQGLITKTSEEVKESEG
ncbi:hypothetical protein AVEN_175948-1 [Araneus ventricosus]|uniref:Rho termination factor N-terminal domain-containing protein n=1 Tax=Araneus ventricosus TaxID=182803 RepID=A0A4Y2GAU9_ARAVE|nr:hypothetical protein AVEN_175948-1 [Araneus ventricosus]